MKLLKLLHKAYKLYKKNPEIAEMIVNKGAAILKKNNDKTKKELDKPE